MSACRAAMAAMLFSSLPIIAARAQSQAVATDSTWHPAPSFAARPSPVGVSPPGWTAAGHDLSHPSMPAPDASVVPSFPALRAADWWKLGAFSAAALLVSTADRRGDAWARRPSVQHNDALRQLANVGDVNGTWVSAGIGPAAWLLGRVRGDSGSAMLGLRTTEAVGMSGVVIYAMKAVSGRRRPYASANNSPGNWDLFGGVRSDSVRSFASGHSALSAAAAVTLAAEWRRQGRSGWKTVGPPLVYSLAALTAGSRVRDRQHWLSDVVTGSAVGMLSAIVVRRWHDAHPRSRVDRIFLAH